MLNLFAKSTRAERVSDTVFFKHRYLTQPIVSPEDTIVAAAQQLTTALKGNAKDHKELEALTKVADLSEEIARDKAEIVRKGQLTSNGIQQYAEASPRVEENVSPRVPGRLSVVYPPAVVASDVGPKHPMPPLSNYITQGEPPEEPTFQRRSKRVAAQ